MLPPPPRLVGHGVAQPSVSGHVDTRPSSEHRGDGDAAVRRTNDDASSCKLSCVQLGYWPDAFLHLFVARSQRHSPLINRGYFARVTALRQLLLQFLRAGVDPDKAPPAKQVLSLGAGFDTTFFQLAAAGVAPALYVELDFAEVVARKRAAIGQHEALYSLVERSAPAMTYALHAVDLRNTAELDEAIAAAGMDTQRPTLVILECVLAYLEANEAAAVLAWAARKFPTGAVITYDPTRPHDAFGRQMLVNLQARGCPFRSIAAAADPEQHAARLRQCGWARAECCDMNTVYRGVLDPHSRRAAERLELLDEVEEWHLMLAHYVLALGVSEPGPDGLLRDLTLNIQSG